MKTAEERAQELLCRIYGDDWHECYDVTGHDLLTPTIEIIERDRQEQREACWRAFCRVEDSDSYGVYDIKFYDKWRASIEDAIKTAGKEE
jgi:hypothetical protein